MCLLREVLVIDAQLVLFKRNISRCQLPQYKKKETNTEQCRRQRSLAVEHRRKHLKNCYAPHLLEVDYIKDLLSSPSQHSLQILSPCCPSQETFPPPAVQTVVSFSGNNRSVGWSCFPATPSYLLDFLGSGKLEPLSIRI